jgi:hypothetical protein
MNDRLKFGRGKPDFGEIGEPHGAGDGHWGFPRFLPRKPEDRHTAGLPLRACKQLLRRQLQIVDLLRLTVHRDAQGEVLAVP